LSIRLARNSQPKSFPKLRLLASCMAVTGFDPS
jgi:hypothetical protein